MLGDDEDTIVLVVVVTRRGEQMNVIRREHGTGAVHKGVATAAR